jgi:hypothetical protein
MGLPDYDSWKLASPPEYEQPDTCVACREQFDEQGRCACGDAQMRADDEYDRYCDAQEAKAELARDR